MPSCKPISIFDNGDASVSRALLSEDLQQHIQHRSLESVTVRESPDKVTGRDLKKRDKKAVRFVLTCWLPSHLPTTLDALTHQIFCDFQNVRVRRKIRQGTRLRAPGQRSLMGKVLNHDDRQRARA